MFGNERARLPVSVAMVVHGVLRDRVAFVLKNRVVSKTGQFELWFESLFRVVSEQPTNCKGVL
jgi:hypothetical protein